MGRLRHSEGGYLRSMQVSSVDLHIFVEGRKSDPYFYARVCESIPNLQVRYEVCTADVLPGESGGKKALINFFTFLRRRKALVSSLGSTKTTCLFFLDKDVDDIQRKQKRSLHVAYTEHYDVQNYIFMHGDLVTGAGSAASVSTSRLSAHLGDAPGWCLQAAFLWREWISLCLRLSEDRVSCEANYRVASRVQTRPYGPVDAQKYEALLCDIAQRHGLIETAFRQRLAITSKKVERLFLKREHHRIFKGKWFAYILADNIAAIMNGLVHDNVNLADRLPCSVAATLNFRDPWADHFRNAVHKVVAML